MARARVEVTFNQRFFDEIMRSAGVQSLQKQVADRVLARAKATAPYNTGDYRDGLRIRKAERRYRTAYLVEGTDRKTLLVEAKTGNLARALKAVGRG